MKVLQILLIIFINVPIFAGGPPEFVDGEYFVTKVIIRSLLQPSHSICDYVNTHISIKQNKIFILNNSDNSGHWLTPYITSFGEILVPEGSGRSHNFGIQFIDSKIILKVSYSYGWGYTNSAGDFDIIYSNSRQREIEIDEATTYLIEGVRALNELSIYEQMDIHSPIVGTVKSAVWNIDGDLLEGDYFTIIQKEPENLAEIRNFTWFKIITQSGIRGWVQLIDIAY